MIVLLVAPLVVGVLAGYVIGGRLRRLASIRIRAVWLLLLAAVIQFFHLTVPAVRAALESWLGASLMVPIFGLVGVWLLVNFIHRPRVMQFAIAAILVGGTMNAVVIAANGRMPHAELAVRSTVQTVPEYRGGASPKHMAADSTTTLLWLADVIQMPWIRAVVSIGDLVLLLGVAWLIATAMRGSLSSTNSPQLPQTQA